MIVSRKKDQEERFTGEDGREYIIALHVCQQVPKIGDPFTLYEVELKKRCVTSDFYRLIHRRYLTDREETITHYLEKIKEFKKP